MNGRPKALYDERLPRRRVVRRGRGSLRDRYIGLPATAHGVAGRHQGAVLAIGVTSLHF